LTGLRRQKRLAWAVPVACAACVIALGACSKPETVREEKAAQIKSETPGLFTVPQAQLAHLQVVDVATANWPASIRTTGTVDWDQDHTTQAITQVNGPISRILVDYGTPVKAGDPLLYVSSPDVVAAIANYRKARNREVFNKKIRDRMKELQDAGAVAIKDFESAEADFNDASTDTQNSLQALNIFGITRQEIDQAEQQGTAIRTELAVRSPISGVIVQKLVNPGQVIQAGSTVCFMISDVSTVWVQGHIFDRDLPQVRTGDPVVQTNPSFNGAFQGKVCYVGSFVDPATRTTPIRIVTENPRGILKKDMFLDAVIQTNVQRNLLVVPVAAVVRDDKNEPEVYLQTEPGKFARRAVTLGPQRNGLVAIETGLSQGDRVLGDGSLFLQFAGTIQ
jgi:cobalt-zinc-cadmium efflux system membrane fusion protein